MVTVSSRRRPLPPTHGAAMPRAGARWSDVPSALAATALTMALLILVAAFAGENVAGGDAGKFWAIVFAAGLGLSGGFLGLLALVLLGDRAREGARYLVPAATGIATGALTGALLLDGANPEAVVE